MQLKNTVNLYNIKGLFTITLMDFLLGYSLNFQFCFLLSLQMDQFISVKSFWLNKRLKSQKLNESKGLDDFHMSSTTLLWNQSCCFWTQAPWGFSSCPKYLTGLHYSAVMFNNENMTFITQVNLVCNIAFLYDATKIRNILFKNWSINLIFINETGFFFLYQAEQSFFGLYKILWP